MNLRIQSNADNAIYMALNGRISQLSSAVQDNEFQKLLEEADFSRSVILSLAETDFIDSSGISWLLATDKRFKQSGGKLVLHSLPLDVQHVFGLMRLNKVLNVTTDEEQATALIVEESHE